MPEHRGATLAVLLIALLFGFCKLLSKVRAVKLTCNQPKSVTWVPGTHILLTLMTETEQRKAASGLPRVSVPSCSLVKVLRPKPPKVQGPSGNSSSS